jgi:hypothetical protein
MQHIYCGVQNGSLNIIQMNSMLQIVLYYVLNMKYVINSKCSWNTVTVWKGYTQTSCLRLDMQAPHTEEEQLIQY